MTWTEEESINPAHRCSKLAKRRGASSKAACPFSCLVRTYAEAYAKIVCLYLITKDRMISTANIVPARMAIRFRSEYT